MTKQKFLTLSLIIRTHICAIVSRNFRSIFLFSFIVKYCYYEELKPILFLFNSIMLQYYNDKSTPISGGIILSQLLVQNIWMASKSAFPAVTATQK